MFFQKVYIAFLCLVELSSMASRPSLQKEFPEKCYEEYGCFQTGPPFHDDIHRPISLLPFDKNYITTKFLLFTSTNPAVSQTIDSTPISVTNSFFNPYLQTKIIIHGFNSSPGVNNGLYWILKDELLRSGNQNVIIVDWSDSNQAPYAQAVANARVVAAQIAQLINVLQDSTGNSPRNVHLIGHSLGAHLAGWTGKRISYLGRITGLDPAGLYFYEADPEARLDASDAEFVDVIHTNGGTNLLEGLGIDEAIGHVDFYLNGGMRQPSCYNKSSAYDSKEAYDPVGNLCSHSRAILLYIASIRNEYCRFEGWPCESFRNFLNGSCYPGFRKRPLEMGLHSMKPPYVSRGQKYYIITNKFYPFCCH